MAKVVIYHNPRCTKSRQTLALIREEGIEPEVVEYLQDPPSATQLDAFLRAMKREPLEAMRTKEPRFKELGLSKKDVRSRRDWIRIMVKNPVLIERPIVTTGKTAALGRPPEDVLEIL